MYISTIKLMYQVTATRRRPQNFDELLGQDFVSATLKKSIEAGKIANAYLFSGPRGCGKTSTARILAKAINCEKGATPSPCGVCNSCEQITSGSSFDVIEIDGASNTGVDDVRKLKDEILFPPNSSRYKVYIIDEVHMLSTNAFNALLKTIEEPPPYVVFIFATTELHKVPATIKSRCQQFNFRLIDIQTLYEALKATATELNIQAEDEALYWIAREGTGSVRDSYTLFDQVAAFSDNHITLEKIQDKLGLTGIDAINDMLVACVHKNPNEALLILHESLNNGISVEQFTIDCTKYFRSLLLVKHGITKESVLGQSASRFSVEVLENWQSTQIERALGIMLQLYKDINFSVNPTFELELAVSRLAWLSDYVPPNELKQAYDNLRQVLMGKDVTKLTQSKTASSQGQTPNVRIPNTQNSQQRVNSQEYANPQRQANFSSPAPKQNANTASSYTIDEPPIESYEGAFDSFDLADSFMTEKPNKNFQQKNSFENTTPRTQTTVGNTKNQNAENETVRSFSNEQDSVHSESVGATPPSFDELKNKLLTELSQKKPLLAVALKDALSFEKIGNEIIIQMEKVFHCATIENHKNIILNAFKPLQINGLSLNVKTVAVKTSPQKQSNEPPEKIKNLMRIFQARLVETIDLPLDKSQI
ncbi:MAG: DNA polymerase III subunit gamma/tau [Treponemataceae bacterium]